MFATAPAPSVLPFGTLCEVCQRPILAGVGVEGEIVCKSFECIRVMKQKQTLPPQLFANMLKVQTGIIRGQEAQVQAEEQKRAALDERIRTEDEELLAKLQGRAIHPVPANTRLVSVASGASKISNLPQQRKRAFRDHLNETIAVAMSNVRTENTGYHKNLTRLSNQKKNAEQLPALPQFTDMTCGQCKGGCCIAGTNKAFVEAPLIRRVMDDNRSLRPMDIYHLYMDHLPNKSITGSCVYHTEKGCNLPRELRSDVCNGYLCDPLDQHHKASVASGELLPALVVSRNHRQFHRHDDGARHDILSVTVVNGGQQQLIDVENI